MASVYAVHNPLPGYRLCTGVRPKGRMCMGLSGVMGPLEKLHGISGVAIGRLGKGEIRGGDLWIRGMELWSTFVGNERGGMGNAWQIPIPLWAHGKPCGRYAQGCL